MGSDQSKASTGPTANDIWVNRTSDVNKTLNELFSCVLVDDLQNDVDLPSPKRIKLESDDFSDSLEDWCDSDQSPFLVGEVADVLLEEERELQEFAANKTIQDEELKKQMQDNSSRYLLRVYEDEDELNKPKNSQYYVIEGETNQMREVSLDEIDPETRLYLEKLTDIKVVCYEGPKREFKDIPFNLESTTVNGVPIMDTDISDFIRRMRRSPEPEPPSRMDQLTTEEMLNDLRQRGLTVVQFNA